MIITCYMMAHKISLKNPKKIILKNIYESMEVLKICLF